MSFFLLPAYSGDDADQRTPNAVIFQTTKYAAHTIISVGTFIDRIDQFCRLKFETDSFLDISQMTFNDYNTRWIHWDETSGAYNEWIDHAVYGDQVFHGDINSYYSHLSPEDFIGRSDVSAVSFDPREVRLNDDALRFYTSAFFSPVEIRSAPIAVSTVQRLVGHNLLFDPASEVTL